MKLIGWFKGFLLRRFTFKQPPSQELKKYALVGFSATAIDAGSLSLFLLGNSHYLLAAAISFSLGLLWSYALSVTWAFRHYKQRPRWQGIGGFVCIGLFGLLINQALLAAFSINWLWLAKSLSIVMVAIWNFLAKKLLLFNA